VVRAASARSFPAAALRGAALIVTLVVMLIASL
jgi:hypothetical protein